LVNATSGRKVVVVGGGTAGLSAAREAAEAGHNVTLYEAQNRLGGSLVLASTVHADNERFLRWLIAEVERLPIDVRLGEKVSVEWLVQAQPDTVIVATGARVETPPIKGVEQAHVLTGALMRQIVAGELTPDEAFRLKSWQRNLVGWVMPLAQRIMTPGLLRRASRLWMPIGREVVIIGSDLAAVELAEFLAHRGRRVHLLETGKKLIPEVGKKRRSEHMDRLDRLRVTVNTCVNIEAITGQAVDIEANGVRRQVRADTVIVAGTPVADTRFADELVARGVTVQSIGDSTGLGLIVKATRTAAEAVAAIA
jgi:2,4-dienoyl-CoA reductase (NADPH2)